MAAAGDEIHMEEYSYSVRIGRFAVHEPVVPNSSMALRTEWLYSFLRDDSVARFDILLSGEISPIHHQQSLHGYLCHYVGLPVAVCNTVVARVFEIYSTISIYYIKAHVRVDITTTPFNSSNSEEHDYAMRQKLLVPQRRRRRLRLTRRRPRRAGVEGRMPFH